MHLIAQPAPQFQAPAVVDGQKIVQGFSLAQYAGQQAVLLVFYPKDFTFVCPTELLALQQRLDEFTKREVAVVACSTDTEEVHLAWLNTPVSKGGIQGVTYPLVADAGKTIAASYGVLGGEWEYDDNYQMIFRGVPVAYRGTFLIDKQGIVRHASVNDMSLGRSVDEMLRTVDMWLHVEQFGEVCPANWAKGDDAMEATTTGLVAYLNKQ